ncbi:MAG: AAA family ATPase, partial [Polyangiales bacterium]
MKLLRLDLTRFRHFTGRSLDFSARLAESQSPSPTLTLFPDGDNRLCLVHGENEAGKSTVLEAIKCLMFGFPDRAGHLAIDVEQSALEVAALVEFQNGARVEARRRKGKKQTLLGKLVMRGGVVGDEIDEGWFHDRMGRPNAALFDAVFGSSLDTLSRGAETLAKDVQGAIYGAGFGGTVQPQEILDDLSAQKALLFADKGAAARRRINASKSRLDDLRATIAAASANKETLQALDEALHDKELSAQERSDRAKELRREIELQKALVDGLEAFRARKEARDEHARLDIPPTFPAGGEATHQRLMEARDRLHEQHEALHDGHAAAASEVDALVVDEGILRDAESIDQLYRGLEGQRQAVRDAPRCELELGELHRATTARLATLRPDWDLQALRGARFDTGALADFDSALGKHARLVAETAAADATVAQLEDELVTIDERLRALPPAVDAGDAQAWLGQCSGALAERKSLDQLDRELETIARKRASLRRKLDPPCPSSVADPTQLPVPRVEDVDRFVESFAALDERIARLDADLATHEAERARLESELAEIEAGGHAPSEAELKAAREHRDCGWQLVLRALSGEGPDAGTLGAYDREARPLPRAYEHAMHLADSVADAMRARADAVQQRALREVHRARLAKTTAALEKKRAAAIEERTRENIAW